MDILERMEEYKFDYSWQYHIRQQSLEEDLKISGLTAEQVENLTIPDFQFRFLETK